MAAGKDSFTFPVRDIAAGLPMVVGSGVGMLVIGYAIGTIAFCT